jgi:beta-lactamase superfamily II metal-dependent hydrolase
MAEPYKSFKVQSYFINVYDGDGAVHLLRQGSNGPILQAILIDGGRNEALDVFEATIKEIRQQVRSNFLFDAVVITHWDGDHYRALTSMLYNDLETHAASTYVKPNATIYYPHTACSKMANASMVVENNELFFRIKLGKKKVDKRRLCKAVSTTGAIGYDLFTNRRAVSVGNGEFVASLEKAYEKCVNLRDELRPVFLIVGVDENFIDGKLTFKRPPDSVKNAKKGMARQINAASIMAIVIWPTGNPKLLRVSLYTGGDAEEARERQLLEWMAQGMDLTQGEVLLDVVKAGHHGSHFAMPETMLNFQNQAFIYSAGEKHGHPSELPHYSGPVP